VLGILDLFGICDFGFSAFVLWITLLLTNFLEGVHYGVGFMMLQLMNTLTRKSIISIIGLHEE